jgi:uncharacterized integral membrane protein
MFCSNCGNKIQEGSNFCPGCGSKAEVNNKAIVKHNNATQIEEVTDLGQLETKLKYFLDTSEEKNYGKSLANSLKAQLEVVHVMQNPVLCKSAFDVMLQSLNDAAETLGDGNELRDIQKRASLMTNNMVFFFDAYICYREDKSSEEGRQLLMKSCDTLAKTANDIFDAVGKNPAMIKAVPFVAGAKLFQNIIKEGLFKKITDFIFKKSRLEELYANYYEFLGSVIEKIQRYKHLFGKSVVLAELIHNKKEALAVYYNPLPEEPTDKGIILGPTLGILVIIVILFIILGVISLINLTPVNLDNAAGNMRAAIKYTGMANIAALVVTSIIVIIRKIIYNRAVKKCYRNRKSMEENLTEIAELYTA